MDNCVASSRHRLTMKMVWHKNTHRVESEGIDPPTSRTFCRRSATLAKRALYHLSYDPTTLDDRFELSTLRCPPSVTAVRSTD